MSAPKLSRPYACQWTTGIERLNVGPSQRHTLAVRMAVGPGVVGSVHLDAKNAGDLLADMAVCMPQVATKWPCGFFRDVNTMVDKDEAPDGCVELRVGAGLTYLGRDAVRALAIELLRLSNG